MGSLAEKIGKAPNQAWLNYVISIRITTRISIFISRYIALGN